MENKYTEMEEERRDLDCEDLESVGGGQKWGPENKSPGPRMNSFAAADGRILAEDRENESAVSRGVSEIAEAIKKRGGFA